MTEREADIGDFQRLLGLEPTGDPDPPDEDHVPAQDDDDQPDDEDVVRQVLRMQSPGRKRAADRRLVESLHPDPEHDE